MKQESNLSLSYMSIFILALITCIFTMPEFVKILDGQCVSGLELWSYRLGILSWFTLGILLFVKENKRKENRRIKYG
jgi:hypothetical protein